MKILFLSDTHGKHCKLSNLPQADVLIHAGDLTWNGTEDEITDFVEWLDTLDYAHKIFIAGNHDECLDGATVEGLPANCHYLCNSGFEIEGIKIWGVPLFLSDELHLTDIYPKKIAQIPTDTDILISHSPPLGILDRTSFGVNIGNNDLQQRAQAIAPRYHLFGHIHESYGILQTPLTTFVNGSVVNENYEIVNRPVILTI